MHATIYLYKYTSPQFKNNNGGKNTHVSNTILVKQSINPQPIFFESTFVELESSRLFTFRIKFRLKIKIIK